MNLTEEKFRKYAIVKEMMQTVDVVKNFNPERLSSVASKIKNSRNILFSGEGSSRIFPAKRSIEFALKNGIDLNMHAEGATQALEYKLSDFAVFGASNSGKTKEVVRLFQKLKESGHSRYFSVIAHGGTQLDEIAKESIVLSCGNEDAVAATKSVIEQALVYDVILRKKLGLPMPDFTELSEKIREALEINIPEQIKNSMKEANILYFAGRNNGVAEELTLKTNEITRKKSNYLEGTYAVHGIEEVMHKKEALIVVDPFQSEEEKFKTCLADKIGIPVFAITSGESIFPSVKIPEMKDFNEYIQMAAGWNLLVSTGVELGINLDMPVRARKIGNEFTE